MTDLNKNKYKKQLKIRKNIKFVENDKKMREKTSIFVNKVQKNNVDIFSLTISILI